MVWMSWLIVSNLTERDIIYVTFINKIYFNDKQSVCQLAKLARLFVVVVYILLVITVEAREEYSCIF